MPTIVLVIWALLLVAGAPPAALRIPGLLVLGLSLLFFLPAEAQSMKDERRHGDDRRSR
jgi:hypothetical protein